MINEQGDAKHACRSTQLGSNNAQHVMAPVFKHDHERIECDNMVITNPVLRRPCCSSNSIGTARGPINTLYATCLSMIRHGSAIRHTHKSAIYSRTNAPATRDTNPCTNPAIYEYDPTVLAISVGRRSHHAHSIDLCRGRQPRTDQSAKHP